MMENDGKMVERSSFPAAFSTASTETLRAAFGKLSIAHARVGGEIRAGEVVRARAPPELLAKHHVMPCYTFSRGLEPLKHICNAIIYILHWFITSLKPFHAISNKIEEAKSLLKPLLLLPLGHRGGRQHRHGRRDVRHRALRGLPWLTSIIDMHLGAIQQP